MLSDPRLRKALQSEGVTVRNDRYLLPVKAEYRSWIPGPIRDRSHSESTLYIEPDGLTLEGDQLLDALDAERDEVQRVLWDLTRRVLAARTLLERLQERLAWIDFTYAKASYAEAFGLTCPEVNDAGILELREARHAYLLWLARDTKRDHRDVDLDATRKRVVPIDVRLGETFKILIVTGPNTGGKTVVLKTVGLNVLMAMSGIPVAAAAGSRVPCYANVFVDIGDEQSIEQSLSTFSSHLKQIMEVLAGADEQALILLDELGSGTDPIEGAALGRALLDKFRAQSWNAIITTHIGSLKEYAYAHDGVENAAMEFDTRSLRPTYRLLMGVPGNSNALAIARRMGLDPDVLQAAEQEMSQVSEPTREIVSRMERSRRRVEKERRRAEKVRRKVQGEARVYKERLREVDDVAEALQVEAQLVVDHAVREAKSKLTPMVEQLKNVPKSHRALVDALSEEVDRLLVGTPLGEKREAFARALKKDDEVYVPKFRERATVKKIDKGGRSLIVLLNGIRTEISFDDVSWLEAPAGTPPET
jgi:DNA mismatch repair protein MutS2